MRAGEPLWRWRRSLLYGGARARAVGRSGAGRGLRPWRTSPFEIKKHNVGFPITIPVHVSVIASVLRSGTM